MDLTVIERERVSLTSCGQTVRAPDIQSVKLILFLDCGESSDSIVRTFDCELRLSARYSRRSYAEQLTNRHIRHPVCIPDQRTVVVETRVLNLEPSRVDGSKRSPLCAFLARPVGASVFNLKRLKPKHGVKSVDAREVRLGSGWHLRALSVDEVHDTCTSAQESEGTAVGGGAKCRCFESEGDARLSTAVVFNTAADGLLEKTVACRLGELFPIAVVTGRPRHRGNPCDPCQIH